MRLSIISVIVAAALLPASIALAAGHKSDDVVVVSLPIGDDLYAAGANVLISKPVEGDAVAAGGSVIVNNTVGADLLAAGGSLIINAPIQDDLRAAGGDVILSSTVGGDLMVFGGNVTIPDGVIVQGDAVIGAGNIQLGGEVRGNLRIHAGSVDLTGTVGGDAEIYATERVNLNGTVKGNAVFAGKQASLGPQAQFNKDVSYWSPEGEMDFGAVMTGGQISFDPELAGKLHHYPSKQSHKKATRGIAGAIGGYFILTLLSGIAVIILSTLLLRGPFRRAGEELHRSFWKSTGIGVLILILLPVIGILSFITIIGIPVGLFFMAIFVFSILFGRVIAAVAFAAWLERRRVTEWSTGRLILVSIGFYAAIKVVSIVPFFGWLAVLFAVLAGYGALIMAFWSERSAI